MGFKVGDRVTVIKDYSQVKVGMKGTVVAAKEETYEDIGGDWDELTSGHTCSGLTRERHGYWVPSAHLTNSSTTSDTLPKLQF